MLRGSFAELCKNSGDAVGIPLLGLVSVAVRALRRLPLAGSHGSKCGMELPTGTANVLGDLLSVEMLFPLSAFPDCCWRTSRGPWCAGIGAGKFGCSAPEPGAGPGVPLFRGPRMPSVSSCEFLGPWSHPMVLAGPWPSRLFHGPCSLSLQLFPGPPVHSLLPAAIPCSSPPWFPHLAGTLHGHLSSFPAPLSHPWNVQTPIHG